MDDGRLQKECLAPDLRNKLNYEFDRNPLRDTSTFCPDEAIVDWYS